MLHFVDHALRLTGSVQGAVGAVGAVPVGCWETAAALMSVGPFAAVIARLGQITWFDKGADTNIAQHHHAWVVSTMPTRSGHSALLFAELADRGRRINSR